MGWLVLTVFAVVLVGGVALGAWYWWTVTSAPFRLARAQRDAARRIAAGELPPEEGPPVLPPPGP